MFIFFSGGETHRFPSHLRKNILILLYSMPLWMESIKSNSNFGAQTVLADFFDSTDKTELFFCKL